MLQLYIDLASSRLACRDIQRIQLYSYTAIHAIQHTALNSVPQDVVRGAPHRGGARSLIVLRLDRWVPATSGMIRSALFCAALALASRSRLSR